MRVNETVCGRSSSARRLKCTKSICSSTSKISVFTGRCWPTKLQDILPFFVFFIIFHGGSEDRQSSLNWRAAIWFHQSFCLPTAMIKISLKTALKKRLKIIQEALKCFTFQKNRINSLVVWKRHKCQLYRVKDSPLWHELILTQSLWPHSALPPPLNLFTLCWYKVSFYTFRI